MKKLRFENQLVLHAMLLSLITSTALAQVNAPTTKGDSVDSKSPEVKQTRSAYLGLLVESVPPVLSRHLPDVIPSGQGVLVMQVAEASPAAKSGIKAEDIIIKYDDQKILSAEQLVKLVHADKPQRMVELDLVRNGKPLKLKVELGSQELPAAVASEVRPTIKSPWHISEWFKRNKEPKARAPWEKFDSITMKKIGDDKYKVDVAYFDKQGKIQRHTFEGNKGEIHKAIENEKDLPEDEKRDLLDSLDLPDGWPAEFRELLPLIREAEEEAGKF